MSSLRCPICDRLFEPDPSATMPFCSERCRLMDLHRWLDQRYGIPYESEDQTEEPEGADPG